MKRQGMKTLLWAICLFIEGIAFHSMGQDVITKLPLRAHHTPVPQYPEGIEPVMLPWSFWTPDSDSEDQTGPIVKRSYLAYLDKFAVWTFDTTAVYGLIDRKFITRHYEDQPGIYAMYCEVDDPVFGMQLCDSLKKMKDVIRVANYAFEDEHSSNYLPTSYFDLKLKDERDTTKLKALVDSLGMKCIRKFHYKGQPITSWRIELGTTRENTIYWARKFYDTGLFRIIDTGFSFGAIAD